MLKKISSELIGILERRYSAVQYCIILVGKSSNGKSDTRLVSNIAKDDLRAHLLDVLDNPTSIET
jgi:hypothetical protein